MAQAVQVRRAYEQPQPSDGTRVLVDRLWPRGLSKASASLDEWCKNVAPSDELRKWYGHDPDRYTEFGRRYQRELTEPPRAEALAASAGACAAPAADSADCDAPARDQRGSRAGRDAQQLRRASRACHYGC